MSEKTALNKGHGHVTPNADGYLARCGGPKICKVCKAELAALKAQPSGVVLAEHLRNAHAFIENTEAFGAAASHGVLERGGVLWDIDASKAALESLKSSPVSAGDDEFCDGNCTWLDHHPSCVRATVKQSLTVSGVDERAAHVIRLADRYLAQLNKADSDYKEGIAAVREFRAALSAPSHGEQVLDALAELLECPASVVQATVPRAGIEAAPPYQVVLDVSVSLTRWKKARAALEAATPSPASQEQE